MCSNLLLIWNPVGLSEAPGAAFYVTKGGGGINYLVLLKVKSQDIVL
jgi:hypothetical protein